MDVLGRSCVEKDYEKAVFWHRKAAAQGDRYSIFYIGLSYLEGYGVEKNEKAAMSRFKEAADLGLGSAGLMMAYCHATGRGAEKNITKALELCRQAAKDKSREMTWIKGDFKDRPGDFLEVLDSLKEMLEEGEGKEYLKTLSEVLKQET